MIVVQDEQFVARGKEKEVGLGDLIQFRPISYGYTSAVGVVEYEGYYIVGTNKARVTFPVFKDSKLDFKMLGGMRKPLWLYVDRQGARILPSFVRNA